MWISGSPTCAVSPDRALVRPRPRVPVRSRGRLGWSLAMTRAGLIRGRIHRLRRMWGCGGPWLGRVSMSMRCSADRRRGRYGRRGASRPSRCGPRRSCVGCTRCGGWLGIAAATTGPRASRSCATGTFRTPSRTTRRTVPGRSMCFCWPIPPSAGTTPRPCCTTVSSRRVSRSR